MVNNTLLVLFYDVFELLLYMNDVKGLVLAKIAIAQNYQNWLLKDFFFKTYYYSLVFSLLKQEKSLFFYHFTFYERLKFHAQLI